MKPAYETLSDPEKRRNYDQTGDPEHQSPGMGGNPFTGGFGGNPFTFTFGGPGGFSFGNFHINFQNMAQQNGGARCVTKRTCDANGNCRTIKQCT